MTKISFKSALLVPAFLSGLACEAGEVDLVQPDGTSEGSRAFEVGLIVDDSALASEMGWADGVPGASAEWAYVHTRRYLFNDAESDDAGVIRFEPEGRGWHWIAAWKEVEVAGTRRVLGGGTKTTGSTRLALSLDEPGSLVISEIYMESPPPWESGDYYGSKYVELYNNSTDVRYLDGLVIGTAYDFVYDGSEFGHHTCAFTEPFRADSGAIWSRSYWRFPGNGTDFPIGPGEAVVVAVSAADHTAVHPTMLDLSDAEFEFVGGGQADNPAAANLQAMGSNHVAPFLDEMWFISEPVDVAGLETMIDDQYLSGGIEYRGFPATGILDVATDWWDTTHSTVIVRAPPCEHPIHPRFDELPGGYLYGAARPEDLLVAPQRRVVRTEDGRAILLDTNTSAVDFENRERTPGWIPSG